MVLNKNKILILDFNLNLIYNFKVLFVKEIKLKVLIVGDIVGRPGLNKLKEELPKLIENENIDFCVVNGENSANGKGIRVKEYNEILQCGADVITMGNHMYYRKEMASEYMLMNGMADLSSGNTSFSVALKRAVARIDLESSFQDAEVNRIVIKEVALTGLVHEAGNQSVLTNLEKNELTKDFGEHPFKNGKESLYYLPEQTSNGHEVEIMMTANGGWHRLRTTLPALKRNTVYTLRVYGNGANLNVEVLTDNWESGDSSASGLTLKGLVDKENSQLSEGVTINERGDTVFVPCWESNFQLTLAAETGAEVSIFGEAQGVTVTPATRSRGLSPVAQINVASRQKMPGSKHEYVYLDVHKDQVQTGRVVLVFTPNPIELSGLIQFDENGECDFNRYVDGELARLILPEGKTVTLRFGEEEAQWMKLTDEGSNTYRLLGGWKPNDPKADGREQAGELIITNEDGSHPETYTIRRLNWGLPVVNINGTWWCKYNLRGNVKNFNDQILSSNDPAAKAGKTLFDYLRDCTPEEFFKLWKWQYQGKTTQGMEVIDDSGVAKLKGYGPSSAHINRLDATAMAPDGYELPSMENFERVLNSTSGTIWLMWDGSHTTAWNGGSNIQRRQRRRNDVTVGSVALSDLIYIHMYNNAEQQYEPLVWYGPGAQWDDSGIKHGHYNAMLWATHSPNNGQGWFYNGTMAGLYPNKNGAGSNDTRLLRFKKSDVEYIYE